MAIDPQYLGVDPDGAASRLDLPRAFVEKLVKKFLNGDELAATKKALANNKLDDLQRHFHTIKGSAGNLGLTGLALFATEVDARAKNGEPATAADVDTLTAIWEELSDEMA